MGVNNLFIELDVRLCLIINVQIYKIIFNLRVIIFIILAKIFEMNKVSEIVGCITDIAPLRWQESWDNAGLLVGDANMLIDKALITLDVTEAVIDEAIEKGAAAIVVSKDIGEKKVPVIIQLTSCDGSTEYKPDEITLSQMQWSCPKCGEILEKCKLLIVSS